MQHILLQSYIGMSDFTYVVNSTGRILSLNEVIEAGLANRDELNRHKRSDYSAEWHIVSPGDMITVEFHNEETDECMVFVVPESGLPNPPVSLDDERTGKQLHEYLNQCCERKYK